MHRKNSRVHLQHILEDLIGNKNVYFQPPESFKLKYPCIIYTKSDESYRHADNMKYYNRNVYDITVIDPDPDSCIPKKVSELPYCRYNRFYVADNLNHNVYTIVF